MIANRMEQAAMTVWCVARNGQAALPGKTGRP
jgi:hypothetical protein